VTQPGKGSHPRVRAAPEAGCALLGRRLSACSRSAWKIARALKPTFVMLEDVDLAGGYCDGPSRGAGALPNTFELARDQRYRTSR
jgi:hypothetical protein